MTEKLYELRNKADQPVMNGINALRVTLKEATEIVALRPDLHIWEIPVKTDMVNHPPHYTQHPKGIECIDVIEENPFVNLAQAMKYIWRVSWGSKGNDIEDMEKAVWYVQREIKRRKSKDT